MREHWSLPDENLLVQSGPEWLLHVVSISEPESAARLILTMWRAWFVRDRWTHEGKWLNIQASVNFLLNYWDSLSCSSVPEASDDKGKGVVEIPLLTLRRPDSLKPKESWSRPEEGWVKVNVDDALVPKTGMAGIGAIVRDHRGRVLLSAWKSIHGVATAEEVEALACREGLHLVAEWIHKPTILESDCSRVISYLSQRQKQRAPAFFTIQDALREAGKLPKVVFRHIGREQNVIAHELAQLPAEP